MKKFAVIIILLSLIIPYMSTVKNVEAQSQPGWYLVKRYTFNGSLNTTEWGVGLTPQAIYPSVTSDNKLNLSMPANPVSVDHCEYFAGIVTKEQYSPSMKIKMRANFQNAIQKGVMIGFWMSQEGEIRNEVTMEYHGSWRVNNRYEITPSIYYNVKSGEISGYWTCWVGHKHYYSDKSEGTIPNLGVHYASFDFWTGWHTFEIDVGYADDQGINRYVIHYIDGKKVFDTGLVQYVPTVPMNIWISISLPGWVPANEHPQVRTYILVDYVEVYYWMDPLDNGSFNNGLTGWGYSGLTAADYDGDGDLEISNYQPYWMIQDIGIPHRNVYVDWKLWFKSAGTNVGGVFNFFWRSKWDYNLSVTFKYKGSNVWTVTFAFKSQTLGMRNEIVDSVTINWNTQLNCRLYKHGTLFGFGFGVGSSGPIIFHRMLSVPELDRKCCSTSIAVSGWDTKIIMDDVTITFDFRMLNRVSLKVEILGAGQVFPESKTHVYYVPVNAPFTLTAIPFNESYIAVWNVEGTVKVGNTLVLFMDKDYVVYVDFQPLNVWSYFVQLEDVSFQKTYGYNIPSVMGSTSPSIGTHNYTVGNSVTLYAYPYSQFWFKGWKVYRHDNAVFSYNNGTSITLNTTSDGRPFWKKFVVDFSASKISVTCNVPPTIYVSDNGILYPIKWVASASTYDFYLPKGTWNLLFYAPGYYSQTVTLTVDQPTETLTVNLQSITYGGGGGGSFPCPRLIIGGVDFGFINIHASNDVVKSVKVDAATLSKVWNGSHVILNLVEGSPEFSFSESDIDMVSLNGKAPVKALFKGQDVTAILAYSDDIKLHLTLNDELKLIFEYPTLTEGEFKLEGVNMYKMCRVFTFQVYFNCSGSFNLWNDTVKAQAIDASATLILQIHYVTLYPIIDIYARNISYINIDVVKLYNVIGGGYHYNVAIKEKLFNGFSVDTDSQLTLDLILPLKPKEVWKDMGGQLIKLDNYIWTGNTLMLTVSPGDPAYSVIYPSVTEQISQVSIDLVWQMLPFILAVALIVAAFSIFRRFAGV